MPESESAVRFRHPNLQECWSARIQGQSLADTVLTGTGHSKNRCPLTKVFFDHTFNGFDKTEKRNEIRVQQKRGNTQLAFTINN
jgi:hypothetical protein